MYKSILVPVDNSQYSNQAISVAVELGKKFESRLTGNHVYAAQMHDYRFKQMEFTLPEEYLQENEIERQRKIHDSLITMGLKLISECYLEDMDKQCRAAGVPMELKMMDGKHHVEILKDMEDSKYDLTVLGAYGIGKTKDSQMGAVCRTVAMHGKGDVWIVKHVPKSDEPERDTILVGIDGSPQSFGAMMTAAELAKKFNKKIALVGVYDPYLHYLVFNGIVDVLTERAAKVFRFEEQNQLHEEIIDTGLAQIYQSHLEVAEKMLNDKGLEVEKVLLDGKVFQKILDYTRKNPPWLLMLGRIGVHSDKDDPDLGSNTDTLLRLVDCDVLLSSTLVHPELDLKAEKSILWTDEAEERMKGVPEQVRGIARTGVLRIAIEQGHSVVTNSVIDEAMDRFMPKRAAEATTKLAESLAFAKARKGNAAMCKNCGTTAAEENPVKCPVCGATDFDIITTQMVEKIVESEGGSRDETAYDGRKLKWTQDARKLLPAIKDNYQKRRAKAYIEKAARMKRLPAVTVEFAANILKELGHEDSLEEHVKAESGNGAETIQEEMLDPGCKLIARDAKGTPLTSVFEWTPEGAERILRVPAGFMRDRVQEKVENLALDGRLTTIDLELVEKGIAVGRQMMEEMLKTATSKGSGDEVPAAKTAPSNGGADGNGGTSGKTSKEYLNEVGVMSEMSKKRAEQ